MNAQAKGGLSILTDEEYYMGEMMPAVNSMSGVGKVLRNGAPQAALRQIGRRAALGERICQHNERLVLAQGYRDDAPARLPQLHAAPLRPHGLRQPDEDAPHAARKRQDESRFPDAGEDPRRTLRTQPAPSGHQHGDHRQVRLRGAARHLQEALPRREQLPLHVRRKHRSRGAQAPRGEVYRFDPRIEEAHDLRR